LANPSIWSEMKKFVSPLLTDATLTEPQTPDLIHDIEGAMIFGALHLEMYLVFKLLSLNPVKSMRPSENILRLREHGRKAVTNTKEKTMGDGTTIFSKMYPEDNVPLLPDLLIADEACNLIVAGSDTTGRALINLTWQVLLHPQVKHKLLEELETIDGLSWESLEQAEYLNCCIMETLRMYPSVPSTLPRACAEDIVVSGFMIPAGTVCATQSWSQHRLPEVYPQPNE
jgi:cytochrome P450